MFKNVCRVATLAMTLLVLGGCVTAGQFNGMDKDPKRWMIVVCTDGPCKPEQRALAAEVIIEAAMIVDLEMTGAGEGAIAGGFANAIASAVATALTVANPLGGSVMAIGAVENASQGVVDGLSTVSYARVYAAATIADLLREDRIKQKVHGYEALEYLHIVPAFVRATSSMEEFRSGRTTPGR